MPKTETRTIALVGPGGSGKTSLAEAMLFAAEAIDRQGSVDAGTTIGDSTPEARSRAGSTELNLLRFSYLDDTFVLMDCPGSAGFSAEGAFALAAADLAIVVVDPLRIQSMSLDAVSDYAAMLALAQPRSLDRCNVLPSSIIGWA